jgi:hypothetical protein
MPYARAGEAHGVVVRLVEPSLHCGERGLAEPSFYWQSAG